MTSTRSARGRYSAAGYTHAPQSEQKGELYIASVPAGSAQDELRDWNRAGYQAERPWREAPEPLFEQEAPAAVPQGVARVRTQKRGAKAALAAEAARARRDVVVCIVLACLVLMIVAAWGQKMVQGVRLQSDIRMYQEQTRLLEAENERLFQQIEQAKSGERIRNLAQNRLGMLRPERAQTETIYIQNAAEGRSAQAQEQESPKLGMLDLLLGLLDMLHIGE